MLTAPFFTNRRDIRPEFFDGPGIVEEISSFALGALDAPECMPAGGNRRVCSMDGTYHYPSQMAFSRAVR